MEYWMETHPTEAPDPVALLDNLELNQRL